MLSKASSANPFAVPSIGKVDRAALLARHSPHYRMASGADLDPRAPLQLGNGNFAFTADVTGLQTLPAHYPVRSDSGEPIGTLLGTMSSWGWHSVPFDHLPGVAPGTPAPSIEVALRDYQTPTAVGGVRGLRTVPYVDLKQEQWGGVTGEPDVREEWLRNNPHRLDLGRIGFWFGDAPIAVDELREIDQRLDLASGILTSHFTLRGDRFTVTTCVAADSAELVVRISRSGSKTPFGVSLCFSYGSQDWGNSQDWTRPEAHTTTLRQVTYQGGMPTEWELSRRGPALHPRGYLIERQLDAFKYALGLRVAAGAVVRPVPVVAFDEIATATEQAAARQAAYDGDDDVMFPRSPVPHDDQPVPVPDHRVLLAATGDSLDAVISFSPSWITCCAADDLPMQTSAEILADTARYWQQFWQTGASISFEGTKDPRATELERRIVLSQYLIAINSAGDTPPAETGLMLNSWRGKFHLEMHWWHAACLPLWGHPGLLARSLQWYESIRPQALATAQRQGYAGVRWPKQTDPSGVETPSSIGTFLIWQQPHPIYLAELIYRAQPSPEVLTRYAGLIKDTADFMASVAVLGDDGYYHLREPLVPAQESYARDRATTSDPTFELAYWAFALRTAATWFARLADVDPGFALPDSVATWQKVAAKIWRPEPKDLPGHVGVYPAIAVPPYTIRTDHPSMLAALGVIPATELIDQSVMALTLADITDTDWEWESTWGWDYAVGAMTAIRLGMPEVAMNWLLLARGKNEYLPNGHNYQTPALPIYLPGNGGLLTAIALAAGGWDNGPTQPAPGFPQDWHVQAEGFIRSP